VIYVPKNPVKVCTHRQVIHIVYTQRPVYDAFHSENYQQPFLQILIARIALPHLSEYFRCLVKMFKHSANQVDVYVMGKL
jgi:hypothetical protein